MSQPAMAEYACPYAVDPRRSHVLDKIQYWVGEQGVVAVVCPWYDNESCNSVHQGKPDRCIIRNAKEE